MTCPLLEPQPIGVDDFREMLADAPEDERWELINGRVIRMMGRRELGACPDRQQPARRAW